MEPFLGSKGPGPCRDCGQQSDGRWPGNRCRPCWDLRLDKRREAVNVGPTALYRLRTADGYLLYIGITIDPKRRFKEHRKTMSWWPDVDPDRTVIEWLDCGGQAAADIEVAAIRAEFPWHNAVAAGDAVWELPPGCPPHPWTVEYRSAEGFWADWARWWAAARDCVLSPEERAALDR